MERSFTHIVSTHALLDVRRATRRQRVASLQRTWLPSGAFGCVVGSQLLLWLRSPCQRPFKRLGAAVMCGSVPMRRLAESPKLRLFINLQHFYVERGRSC